MQTETVQDIFCIRLIKIKLKISAEILSLVASPLTKAKTKACMPSISDRTNFPPMGL